MAQSLSGTVTDAETGERLPDAIILSSSYQTITDKNGTFTFPLGALDDSLLISRLGYLPRKLSMVSFNQDIQISLYPSPIELNQIIVTADHTSKNLKDFPGGLGLIRSVDFQRDQDVSIVPALNRVPGVYMQSGALNTNRITIRGMGARSPFSTNRIKAYYDEIPLTTGDGETTLEDIDLSFFGRLELIKGPNASLYGAGLGGTIRIIPTPLTVENNIQLDQSIGSFGLIRTNFHVKNRGKKGEMTFGANRTSSDGYRENNRYERIGGLLTYKRQFEKHQLTFIGQFIALDAQIPSSIDSATFVNNPRAAAPNWLAVQGFEKYQKGLIGISLHSTVGRFTAKNTLFGNFQVQDERRPFNILNDNRVSAGIRSVWNADWGRHSVSIGTEIFAEGYDWSTFETLSEGKGQKLSDNQESRFYMNLFIQDDILLLPKLSLIAGLNLNFTQFKLQDQFASNGDISGERSFPTITSPRLALLYRYHANHSLYFASNHGFSTPSLEETLAPDGEINPDIKPETGWNFELGAKGGSPDGWFYQIALYHMPIENLLVSRRTAEDAFVGINAGSTHHNGLELEIKKTWNIGNRNSLSLYLNHLESNYFFKQFIDGESDFSGNKLTGAPNRMNSGGLDISMNSGFNLYINYIYVGKLPMNDANSLFSEDYFLTNIKANYTLNFSQWSVVPYAGINNVLNEKYASMIQINASSFGGNTPRYFYPGLPINYFGGIKVRYTFNNKNR